MRLIDADAAIEAVNTQAEEMSHWSERYQEQRRGVLTAVNIVTDCPSVQPESARTFVELVVEYPNPELCTYKEYKGKPYYSIKYIENGETYIGYGTYNPEVLSQYLKEYFILSAQPEQRWIPCSERLPEEYGEYLVTYKSDGDQKFMDIVEYEPSFEFDHEKNRFKGNWLFADDCRSVNPEVLAWMPLPEIYQEGGE